jgi:transglutaminase-like putative cysteine protease
MYDIRQFKPALYLLLFLGMSAFALAIEAPGLWLLAVSVLGLHGWLVKTGRFRPFPRLIANLITLVAVIYTFEALRSTAPTIITIGQFLVFLQLVKLFELRANRDYAQLLILSLLLMVAGAISTPSLAFGVLLIIYLFVSLYVCLLFHLKVENEHALKAQTMPREKLNEVTLKQDQRYLPRSMRRLAALVAVAGIGMAVFVFLFCPRGYGAGMFGQLQFQKPALTGFSQDVSLADITRISQNNEIVAQVQMWKNDKRVEGTEPLLLRGRTFSRYDPRQRNWVRTPAEGEDSYDPTTSSLGFERRIPSDRIKGDIYRLHIALHPTGTDTLFILPGLLQFTPSRAIGNLSFAKDDETLSFADTLNQRFDYEIKALNKIIEPNPLDPPDSDPGPIASILRMPRGLPYPGQFPHKWRHRIPQEIAQYARRPEVSGVDEKGQPLASLLPADHTITSLDQEIAANIEKHLRTTFSYTLDLTSEENDRVKDPIVQFLYTWKKGHCEYFASSMVLMCQSLGMQARMVTGFRSSEYDGSMGHYYVVRQSHAHAWVEVKTLNGWQTFDPTSGNEIDSVQNQSALQSLKHFFDWLEYKWAANVVAYDADRRDNLVNKLEHRVADGIVKTRMNPNSAAHSIEKWWQHVMRVLTDWFNGDGVQFSEAMTITLILLAGLLILSYQLFRMVRQRRLMRRRAAKIGLENLPTAEQIRLARQLGFYEQLMTMLERRRIVRPVYQTPAEFSDSLAFLPNEAFDAIRRLTRIFYSIRFGRRELAQEEQKDLESTVNNLEPLLESSAGNP